MKSYDPTKPLFFDTHSEVRRNFIIAAIAEMVLALSVIEHYPRRDGISPGDVKASGPVCVTAISIWRPASAFRNIIRRPTSCEPFDRYLALWHYLPKLARQRGNIAAAERRPDFATALQQRARKQRSHENRQSIIWYFPQPPDVAEIGEQMDRSYVFVGIVERYQDSLDALAGALGKKRVKIPHLNDTPRERNDYEEWRPFYRKHFADEYAV
jgi:hypothetical protein